jgi:S-DNA-T family DNA segregation ATPase FtsK/SpoIIIE
VRLKLTLESASAESRDLVATVDPSSTIGDLAAYIASTDPRAPPDTPSDGDGELTLVLVDGHQSETDPSLTVPESGLRSGLRVALTRRSGSSVAAGRPMAVASIVAGPDSGNEFALSRGTAYIGRGHGCDVQVTDSSVSRRHAKLLVAGPLDVAAVPTVEVVDLGSANGILVAGVQVPRAPLGAGDRVRLGDTEVEVRLLEPPPAAAEGEHALAFSRSSRIAPLFEGHDFDLPDLPQRPKPSRLPWLAMLLPALLGMGMFAFTRSPYSLVFVAMSPMMMLGTHVEQRRGSRQDFEQQMRDFRQDLEVVAGRVRRSLLVEAGARRQENPSGVECAEAARRLSPLLWTRRGDTSGFLQLRLGQGTLPSRSSAKMPAFGRSTARAWVELAEALEGTADVTDVPVVVDPLATGAFGVSGLRQVALPAARSLVLQAVSLHSPAELIVAAFASTTSAHDWDWLKWVPHTSSPHSPIVAGHLASTAPACSALLSELEELVGPAARAEETDRGQGPSHPRVLVLVENDTPAERGRLVQLAEKGWRQGICFLWLAPTTSLLPAACRVFLEVGASEGAAGCVGYVGDGTQVTRVLVDTLTLAQTLAAARSLAPVEDSGAPVDDDSDLPSAVSLLSLVGTALARSENAVIERWGESRSILTGPFAPPVPSRRPGNLRAVVGQSAQGTFAVDLRVDGPHALVGGTTGAGKSELLQAWILGMASAHSPQRVTFLLVD